MLHTDNYSEEACCSKCGGYGERSNMCEKHFEKQPADTPAYIGQALSDLEDIIRNSAPHRMDQISLMSKGEGFVMERLLEEGGKSNPGELSRCMGITKGRMSAILNSLERKGSITRETDKTNRRNIIVTLTDSGRESILSEIQERQRAVARMLEKLGEDDTNELVRLTRIIAEICREEAECSN